jgi:hypothetical protein
MTTLPKHFRLVSSEPATPTRAPEAKRVGALTRARGEQDAEEDAEEDAGGGRRVGTWTGGRRRGPRRSP